MPLARDTVAFTFWPDESESDAKSNLRRHLFMLSNDVLPEPADGKPWILADKRTLQWNIAAGADVDLVAFEDETLEARQAVALYRGPFLNGNDDEWVQGLRRRYHDRAQTLLMRLCDEARERHAYSDAIAAVQRALELDPWREDALRALLVLRAAVGDRSGAVQTYRDFARRLYDELGVTPMAETTAEYARIAGSTGDAIVPPPSIAAAGLSDLRADVAVPQTTAHPEALREVESFTGREDELSAIAAAFDRGPARVVICGMGGVGKSALAREYARRRRGAYRIVWWFPSETQDEIIESLLRLGQAIAPALAQGSDRRAAAEYIQANVLTEERGRMLLIFDNLEDRRLLARWLPPNAACDVIATTRQTTWGPETQVVTAAPWSADEAATYLARASGRPLDDAMRALAAHVGYLPLALAHASAYLCNVPTATVERYLARVEQHLARAPRNAEYERAVFATFTEAIATAEREAPGARALLTLAAHLAPDAIPSLAFTRGAAALSDSAGVDDPDLIDEALGALLRLSLVSYTAQGNTYAVHRLVQHACRATLGAERSRARASAVVAIDRVFPDVTFATWSLAQSLLAHAVAVLDALPDDEASPAAVRLAARVSTYLRRRASYQQAERFARRAVTLADANADAAGERMVALENLASLLRETNRIAEAEPLTRSMITEASPQRRGTLLNSLGVMLHYVGRFAEARTLFREALAHESTRFGADHANCAIALGNAAIAAHEVGELNDAEAMLRQALAIDERSFGDMHPDVATDLCNLAWVLYEKGEYTEAEALQLRAIAIRGAVYGEHHPVYAYAVGDHAVLLEARGANVDSRAMHLHALTVCEDSFGAAHPVTTAHENALASSLARSGELAAARERLRRAYSADAATLPPQHPALARDANNLAAVIDDRDEAERLLLAAAHILQPHYGEAHARTQAVRRNMQRLDEGAARAATWHFLERFPSRGLRE